jgi:hypothetical protein
MSRLAITFIDVGWGDSVLLEAENDRGELSFAVVDSNDSSQSRSSFLFLKRYFERKCVTLGLKAPWSLSLQHTTTPTTSTVSKGS